MHFALRATLVLHTFALAIPASTQPAPERLKTLFEQQWENTLREAPVFSTTLGDTRYNDRLSDEGLAAEARRLDSTRVFLARLRAIPRDSLARPDQINRDIMERSLRDAIQSAELFDFLIPITNREGFHTSFPQIADRLPFRTTQDYRNYITRLSAFRKYSGGFIEVMREGARRGMVLPRVSLDGIEGALSPHIVTDPAKSLLWKPFTEFPSTVPEADRPALIAAAREAITTSVAAGYRDFLDFIQKEYTPKARTSLGASQLPEGRKYYEFLVRYYTTLDDATPDAVHETGLREVARIRSAMDTVMRSAKWSGDFKSFVAFLRTDPRFYAKTPTELLEKNSYFLKLMDGELPRLFGKLPRMPYGIKTIPDYIAPRTTTAYYQQPSGDGTRSGTYWVNVHDLKSRPLYEVEALASHEAVPGHHLQLALQQELTDVPNFRRFSGATAFVEGWALYSESLGKEAGFYKDPYSEFGRLSFDMWRACRLVIDTGIHWKGWTRQRAIDYLASNSALSLVNVTNEVDRYIAWPGQALAYKTGQMKIRALRAEAETELGSKFDIRKFHDVVLGSGSVPLVVLEENVRGWIAAENGKT
ncbi:MAG TPA: DUF885 domain-containing protein [Gemmatimonadaceae bacterium]|nr:DUF885 domain-containing protein [Gemmatimonadaceae bacterium]